MKETPWEVGDSVVRQVNPFSKKWRGKLRHGMVVERYSAVQSLAHTHFREPELYAVRWDDTGQIERGYFRGGLDPEPLKSRGVPS